MDNSNNNDLKNHQQIEYIHLKNNFYKTLIQELFIHSLKIINDYEKLLKQLKTSNSLDAELKNLNSHITGVFYSDLNNRKSSLKKIRSKFKSFNKSYNKQLYNKIKEQ